jgi:adenosine deaminase
MKHTAPFLLYLGLAVTAAAQNPAPQHSAEFRADHAYQKAAAQGPEALRAFLVGFPKGADLHVHLSGAVYAETFLREAAEDGACIDPDALAIVKAPCTGKLVPASELSGNLSASSQLLYDKLVDALSMRSFVPSASWSGHDQFFATFGRVSGLKKDHAAEWVDEVASRSAAQNQQYLELMQTPPFGHAIAAAQKLGWPAGEPDFANLREQMLSSGLREDIAAGREEMRSAEAGRRQLEHCESPQAAPACQVQVRFIYQILRGNPPQQVFAQTLLGFETIAAAMAAHDDTFVGINFVMPEDGYLSMRDYTLQMCMLDYLHSVYPQVPITLHAGELAGDLVPPEGMRFHIREAVELGHAQRIGHGVDVMHEDNASQLLKEMADRHVMVEINLSSNEGILGVQGAAHPFPLYRAAHVPVALSTDDEGVSRIDITHEYVRAALDYKLSYSELKQLARTGMAHDFLPGTDLWASSDVFTTPAAACKADQPGSDKPSSNCKALLDQSQKAAAEWELERRFREFERRF